MSREAVEMARIRVEAVLASEMEKVGGGNSITGTLFQRALK